MYKTTAVVEPHIIELESIILETQTGKKIEICNELDSYAWIENNLSMLRKVYKEKVFEVLRSLTIFVFIGILFYFQFKILAAGLTICTIMGIGLSVNEAIGARNDVVEFNREMESSLLEPNMNKSIRCYYTNHSDVTDAWALLDLNQKTVIDYEICSDELNTNFLKVVSADKETGDIETRDFRHLKTILNMNIKHPIIRILPHGMQLHVPYKTIP